ncbi:MAG: DUF3102 domain-containing protein [Ruminococcaceae bacterium]|nr:DUF3102 domain-containing protein [Oscillospiraceae bacterium]
MSNEVIQIRDAEIVAAEINTIKNQTKRLVLSASVEIGRRLEEAKSLVDHGQWQQWLKDKVDYSQSTADNLMRISRECGDEQVNLFSGESKSQTFANLSYSQAVALFALPADAREEFVKSNDVNDMTSRQLQEAIKAQKKAEAEKADAEAAKQAAEKQKAETESKNRNLQNKLDQAYLDADKQVETVESLQKEIEAAKKEAAGPSPEELKKMRAEIREKVKADYEKKSTQLTLEKQNAESKAKEIEEQYQEQLKKAKLDNQSILAQKEAAEKKLSLAAPEVEKFSVHFENLQVTVSNMKMLLGSLEKGAPETAGKLRAALKKLLDGYSQSLSNEG